MPEIEQKVTRIRIRIGLVKYLFLYLLLVTVTGQSQLLDSRDHRRDDINVQTTEKEGKLHVGEVGEDLPTGNGDEQSNSDSPLTLEQFGIDFFDRPQNNEARNSQGNGQSLSIYNSYNINNDHLVNVQPSTELWTQTLNSDNSDSDFTLKNNNNDNNEFTLKNSNNGDNVIILKSINNGDNDFTLKNSNNGDNDSSLKNNVNNKNSVNKQRNYFSPSNLVDNTPSQKQKNQGLVQGNNFEIIGTDNFVKFVNRHVEEDGAPSSTSNRFFLSQGTGTDNVWNEAALLDSVYSNRRSLAIQHPFPVRETAARSSLVLEPPANFDGDIKYEYGGSLGGNRVNIEGGVREDLRNSAPKMFWYPQELPGEPEGERYRGDGKKNKNKKKNNKKGERDVVKERGRHREEEREESGEDVKSNEQDNYTSNEEEDNNEQVEQNQEESKEERGEEEESSDNNASGSGEREQVEGSNEEGSREELSGEEQDEDEEEKEQVEGEGRTPTPNRHERLEGDDNRDPFRPPPKDPHYGWVSEHEQPRDVPTRLNYPGGGLWAQPPAHVDLPFKPTQIYSQIRRHSTVKFLPREEAIAAAATAEELINAPRLREVISHKKTQQVYEEEGFEDTAYDHGAFNKHGEKKEDEHKASLAHIPEDIIAEVPGASDSVRERNNHNPVTLRQLGRDHISQGSKTLPTVERVTPHGTPKVRQWKTQMVKSNEKSLTYLNNDGQFHVHTERPIPIASGVIGRSVEYNKLNNPSLEDKISKEIANSGESYEGKFNSNLMPIKRSSEGGQSSSNVRKQPQTQSRNRGVVRKTHKSVGQQRHIERQPEQYLREVTRPVKPREALKPVKSRNNQERHKESGSPYTYEQERPKTNGSPYTYERPQKFREPPRYKPPTLTVNPSSIDQTPWKPIFPGNIDVPDTLISPEKSETDHRSEEDRDDSGSPDQPHSFFSSTFVYGHGKRVKLDKSGHPKEFVPDYDYDNGKDEEEEDKKKEKSHNLRQYGAAQGAKHGSNRYIKGGSNEPSSSSSSWNLKSGGNEPRRGGRERERTVQKEIPVEEVTPSDHYSSAEIPRNSWNHRYSNPALTATVLNSDVPSGVLSQWSTPILDPNRGRQGEASYVAKRHEKKGKNGYEIGRSTEKIMDSMDHTSLPFLPTPLPDVQEFPSWNEGDVLFKTFPEKLETINQARNKQVTNTRRKLEPVHSRKYTSIQRDRSLLGEYIPDSSDQVFVVYPEGVKPNNDDNRNLKLSSDNGNLSSDNDNNERNLKLSSSNRNLKLSSGGNEGDHDASASTSVESIQDGNGSTSPQTVSELILSDMESNRYVSSLLNMSSNKSNIKSSPRVQKALNIVFNSSNDSLNDSSSSIERVQQLTSVHYANQEGESVQPLPEMKQKRLEDLAKELNKQQNGSMNVEGEETEESGRRRRKRDVKSEEEDNEKRKGDGYREIKTIDEVESEEEYLEGKMSDVGNGEKREVGERVIKENKKKEKEDEYEETITTVDGEKSKKENLEGKKKQRKKGDKEIIVEDEFELGPEEKNLEGKKISEKNRRKQEEKGGEKVKKDNEKKEKEDKYEEKITIDNVEQKYDNLEGKRTNERSRRKRDEKGGERVKKDNEKKEKEDKYEEIIKIDNVEQKYDNLEGKKTNERSRRKRDEKGKERVEKDNKKKEKEDDDEYEETITIDDEVKPTEKNLELINIQYDGKTTEIPVDVEMYPFYTMTPNEGLARYSPLRYAVNPKFIPRKTGKGMEFYDSRDHIECEDDDLGPPEDFLPEKKEDGELAGKPGPNGPRLKGLGDKIKCLRTKYFGSDPLDNPFFKEETVSAPKVFASERSNMQDQLGLYADIMTNIKANADQGQDQGRLVLDFNKAGNGFNQQTYQTVRPTRNITYSLNDKFKGYGKKYNGFMPYNSGRHIYSSSYSNKYNDKYPYDPKFRGKNKYKYEIGKNNRYYNNMQTGDMVEEGGDEIPSYLPLKEAHQHGEACKHYENLLLPLMKMNPPPIQHEASQVKVNKRPVLYPSSIYSYLNSPGDKKRPPKPKMNRFVRGYSPRKPYKFSYATPSKAQKIALTADSATSDSVRYTTVKLNSAKPIIHDYHIREKRKRPSVPVYVLYGAIRSRPKRSLYPRKFNTSSFNLGVINSRSKTSLNPGEINKRSFLHGAANRRLKRSLYPGYINRRSLLHGEINSRLKRSLYPGYINKKIILDGAINNHYKRSLHPGDINARYLYTGEIDTRRGEPRYYFSRHRRALNDDHLLAPTPDESLAHLYRRYHKVISRDDRTTESTSLDAIQNDDEVGNVENKNNNDYDEFRRITIPIYSEYEEPEPVTLNKEMIVVLNVTDDVVGGLFNESRVLYNDDTSISPDAVYAGSKNVETTSGSSAEGEIESKSSKFGGKFISRHSPAYSSRYSRQNASRSLEISSNTSTTEIPSETDGVSEKELVQDLMSSTVSDSTTTSSSTESQKLKVRFPKLTVKPTVAIVPDDPSKLIKKKEGEKSTSKPVITTTTTTTEGSPTSTTRMYKPKRVYKKDGDKALDAFAVLNRQRDVTTEKVSEATEKVSTVGTDVVANDQPVEEVVEVKDTQSVNNFRSYQAQKRTTPKEESSKRSHPEKSKPVEEIAQLKNTQSVNNFRSYQGQKRTKEDSSKRSYSPEKLSGREPEFSLFNHPDLRDPTARMGRIDEEGAASNKEEIIKETLMYVVDPLTGIGRWEAEPNLNLHLPALPVTRAPSERKRYRHRGRSRYDSPRSRSGGSSLRDRDVSASSSDQDDSVTAPTITSEVSEQAAVIDESERSAKTKKNRHNSSKYVARNRAKGWRKPSSLHSTDKEHSSSTQKNDNDMQVYVVQSLMSQISPLQQSPLTAALTGGHDFLSEDVVVERTRPTFPPKAIVEPDKRMYYYLPE